MLAAGPIFAAAPVVEDLHRLYDLSFVSATNPVVVSVKDYQIEIPLSEFKAYLASDLVYTNGKSGPLTPAEKRQYLEQLLDEHFLLYAAYQKKADQAPGVVEMLKNTQNMLLEEAILQRDVMSKAKSQEEYDQMCKTLRHRLFEKTDVHVSGEAYDKFKAAAVRITKAEELLVKTESTNELSPDVDGLKPEERRSSLATCKVGMVSIGDALQAYSQQPLTNRPNVNDKDAFIHLLEEMYGEGLLVEEARATGLEKSSLVREKLQLNRNVLSRMWFLDQITAQASAEMKKPGTEEKLKQWHKDHLKSLYTYQDENGKEKVGSFEEDHDRVQDDYFQDVQDRLRADAIQALRKGHKIVVDEQQLKDLAVNWPPKPADAEVGGMEIPVAADAASGGKETNAVGKGSSK